MTVSAISGEEGGQKVVVLTSDADEAEEAEKKHRFPDFWPTKPNEPMEIGWLRVGFCNSKEMGDGGLTRYEFLLSSSREDYALTCHLWRLHTWPRSPTDEASADFLKLQSILVSNHAATANGSTIVVDE